MGREEFEDKINNAAGSIQQLADQLGEIASHLSQIEYADYAASSGVGVFDGDVDDLADVVSKLGEWSDALSDISHEW